MADIIYVDETSSTNTLLKDMLRRDAAVPEMTLVYAGFQTAGRGQRGNTWESARGQNISCSLLLRPVSVAPQEQFVISEIVSLAVADLIDRHCPGTAIKWPNDIYHGDRKICGILIENQLDASGIVSSIAGIGININQDVFVSDAPNPVSLRQLTGVTYDIGSLVEELLQAVAARYGDFMRNGDAGEVHEDYLRRLYRLGTVAVYVDAGGQFTGRIVDVRRHGRLVIEDSDGRTRDYAFKEVSFVI